MKKSIKNYLY